MKDRRLVSLLTAGIMAQISLGLAGGILAASMAYGQQGNSAFAGMWAGSKGQYDPDGNSFTLNFSFSLAAAGSYDEVVKLGGLQILHASGSYDARPARRSDDPSFTHLLTFHPESTSGRSGGALVAADRIKLEIADLPVDADASYFVSRSSLAPCGQLTLKKGSGSSWGLKCQAESQSSTQQISPTVVTTVALQVSGQTQPPEHSPEDIFLHVRNRIERIIYYQSSPEQQKVMRDQALQHVRRMNERRTTIYDDLGPDLAPEPIFKGMQADPQMLDTYNTATPDQQHAMRTQALIAYTVNRLGIALNSGQLLLINIAASKP